MASEAKKEKIYKVEHVSKIFGGRYVLNDVNFDVFKGEILGIIGASGSGKTTLLNSLVGFIKPEKGDVKFRNVDMLNARDAESFRSIYKHQNELKRTYGFAAQEPSFYPNLTVKENLYYFGTLYNLSKESIKSNAEYLLNLVGLGQSQHILAKNLSGGMQRRLDITCSLIHDPKILILDEPTADLDPVLCNKIWNFLRIINQRGTTIILASHHIVDMENLCDRVGILKDGTVAAMGKPEEIKSKSFPVQTIHLKSSPGDYKKIIGLLNKEVTKEINSHEIKNKALAIHTKNPSMVIHNILKAAEKMKEKIINVEFVKPSLDRAFIRISEEGKRFAQQKSADKTKKKRHHHKKKKHHKKRKRKKE